MSFGKHNIHPAKQQRLASRQRAPRVGLLGGRHRRRAATDRFWARVDRRGPAECWLFAGAPGHKAGHIHIVLDDGSRTYAHRFAWELAHGPIPAGLRILHTCDDPRCVNPAHLLLGTQRENIHDSIQKGRYNTFGIQKLTAAQVQTIRARVAAGQLQREVAAAFGIARNSVSSIVTRRSWRHVP